MAEQAILRKLERIRQGGVPRVLDLFAGCGGISLGFSRAGFNIDAAVEFDPHAARSHAMNFHRHLSGELFERHAQARDITKTEPEDLVSDFDLGPVEDAFDVVVGGPPCQAYARVGRAKLREVAQHPQAFKVDARGNLYLRYLHYVSRTKPLALLMENVPDIMNYGGHNVAEEIAEALTDMGYSTRYTLANASRYGVPQMRDRIFLIAVHHSLGVAPQLPEPRRHVNLPSGYSGTRAVAFKNVLPEVGAFSPEKIGSTKLPYAVTAAEALADLPPITLHLEGKMKGGARRFTELAEYTTTTPSNDYVRLMREWPGFESIDGVKDHVIRNLPRDTGIFREMKHGDEYPAAHRKAVELFEREVLSRQAEGAKLSAAEREQLRSKMVPPYPVTSFPNRWWKLRPDEPSRTLLAHIGKDTYSHIHFDSAQARTISVREAARLQSFPDGFVFSGTMNPAFRQIGNAVPPLMAAAIAEGMMTVLTGAAEAPAKVSRAA
jgi:DNA (cytosine-5)-methyltransferase 1